MTYGPIAVGGIDSGGSRIVAHVLRELGVFLGSDLDADLQSNWYSALFDRRDVLADSEQDFAALAGLFCRQMATPRALTRQERKWLRALGRGRRQDVSAADLARRTESFQEHCDTGEPHVHWGWHALSTHILIDRFLALRPDLRYVHVGSDGRDFAFNGSHEGMRNWGPVLLSHDIRPGPHDALSFWVAVHRRMRRVSELFPDRVLHIDPGALLASPETELERLFGFLGVTVDPARSAALCTQIREFSPPEHTAERSDAALRKADLKYLENFAAHPAMRVQYFEAPDPPGDDRQGGKAGGMTSRAYVGPPAQYDFMGATQFRLLTALGLREEHKLVDIGCGSLRAGRFLIPYLAPGHYVGTEPNGWLWQDAIAHELGSDFVRLKRPRILPEDDFRLSGIAPGWADFVVAQSIYSHTGQDQIETSLAAVARVLAPGGQALFTVVTPENPGAKRMGPGAETSGWVYPGCVTYSVAETVALCDKAGLFAEPLDWFHPRQTWFRATKDPANRLSDEMKSAMGTGKPLFDARFNRPGPDSP